MCAHIDFMYVKFDRVIRKERHKMHRHMFVMLLDGKYAQFREHSFNIDDAMFSSMRLER